MNRFTITLATGAAALAVAAPGAAAHPRPTPATVAQHVRSADQALGMVSNLVEGNRDAAAAVQFARNRVQTASAVREASRLRGPVARVAAAQRRVAQLQDDNAGVYADIVDEVGGGFQSQVAGSLTASVAGRQKAVSVLTALLPRLPQPAQRAVTQAIAMIAGNGDDQATDLAAALESGNLPGGVRDGVSEALKRTAQGTATAVERLRSLLDRLPPQARTHVAAAIGRIESAGQRVTSILNGVLAGRVPPAGVPTAPQGAAEIPVPVSVPVPVPVSWPVGG